MLSQPLNGLRRRMPALLTWSVSRGLLPFSTGAARSHQEFMRRWPEGRPRTFNEKVQYKLIHDRRKLVTVFADKFQVRDYVAKKLPALRQPKLLGVFDSAEAAVAGAPAGPWVMKATHGAGMVVICKPGETVPASVIRSQARQWLQTDYALKHWEWQYFRLPKRIIFEEYLGDGRVLPADYKLFVIHQKVRLISVDQGRFASHTRDLFYPDWTWLRSRKGAAKMSAVPPPRPKQLAQMIKVAESLAADTDFVRVDLYVVNGEIYFGELTHSPAAGTVPFEDPRLDLELGNYWTLPARYV